MTEFLIGIMYHDPKSLALWNQGVTEDYESTTGLFILAETPEEAIAWGEQVGQSLLDFVNPGSEINWKAHGHWCWVEESPSSCDWSHCLDFFQHIQAGEHPDLERMTSNAYARWLDENAERHSNALRPEREDG